MKRIIQHPPQQASGRQYWRGLEEYASTPEFQEWLGREFPQGAAEFPADSNGLSRRNFISMMGASMALAGLGLSGCRRPEAYLVPFTKTPEWMVPGKVMQYATAMPRRSGAVPLMAHAFDGRPIKMDGNPLHPLALGKSDAFAQASILDLYDPDRSRSFRNKGKRAKADDFYAELEKLRLECVSRQGNGLAFLVDEVCSPTRERLREELLKQFPQMVWTAYEPLGDDAGREAAAIAFGQDLKPSHDYSKADLVLAVDCDFLGADSSGLKDIREFSNRRRVRKPGDAMNRLYAVEGNFTLTGMMADHRLRLLPGEAPLFLARLIKSLASLGVGTGLVEFCADLQSLDLAVPEGWIEECAKDLVARRGKSLVLVGSHQPVYAQLLGHLINEALGNLGNSLNLTADPRSKAGTIQELAALMKDGKITTLVILGGNPVYHAPAELEWAKLQAAVPTVIRLGSHEDETSKISSWSVPAAHYLESWSDALAQDGTYLSIQPLILPLHGGISELQLLARFAGYPSTEGPEWVQETFKQRTGITEKYAFEEAWLQFIHDGHTPSDKLPNKAPAQINAGATSAWLRQNPWRALTAPSADSLQVLFTADSKMDDGRYINNGWMQELPDTMTKLTWDNAALISTKTAQTLGVKSQMIEGRVVADIIQINLEGRSVEAPVLITPGLADHLLVLPLGYGRSKVGRVGQGSGFNAYALRTSSAPFIATGATMQKTGRTKTLAVTQEHSNMEGRNHFREAPLDYFNENPKWVGKVGMDSHIPPAVSIYKNPVLDGEHQWAMVIDLNTCTGCNACVIACQSENNIPIVGREQVINGREMHWMRIDRYFEGDPTAPESVVQPVGCQHCENAPCETVCPVNATVHSEEGLNVMAYNRCIGTRYCANNCPFKVRRFNFFDYNKRDVLKTHQVGPFEIGNLYFGPLGDLGSPDTIKMQKNPNVTVRIRGVMEKCTYCVQRLEEAKIAQRIKARDSANTKVPTDSVQSACQQACPTEAIIFGDKSDPESQIAKSQGALLQYGMLEYLNLKPRTTYLAKLRNVNPAMPGAKEIARYSTDHIHEHGHGHGHGDKAGHHDEGHHPEQKLDAADKAHKEVHH